MLFSLDISNDALQTKHHVDEMDQDISLLKHLSDPKAIFNWLVEDFSKKKAAAHNGEHDVVFSPPFYSFHNGYRMRLELYPSGHETGEGSHISVYLAMIRGPYDETLQWPYRRKYEVSGIQKDGQKGVSQITDTAASYGHSSWRRPTRETKSRLGWPQFVELYKLHEYLKNDKLFITVRIVK